MSRNRLSRTSGKSAVPKKRNVDALLERLNKYRGKLPPDFKFNRDAANAPE